MVRQDIEKWGAAPNDAESVYLSVREKWGERILRDYGGSYLETLKEKTLQFLTPSPDGDGTYYIAGKSVQVLESDLGHFGNKWPKEGRTRDSLPAYSLDNDDFLEGGRYYERLQARIAEEAKAKSKPATKEGFFY